jgi:hypothetical protein
MSSERFSQRRGIRPSITEITIRDEAPRELREAVLQIAREAGCGPSGQRSILTRILRVLPDSNNWSEYPNVWGEVQELILRADWYSVYDYIEALHQSILQSDPAMAAWFAREINDFMVASGIGWQLNEGVVEVRGPEAFEAALAGARDTAARRLPRAQLELHEALADLSRRPAPDLTGAIQHATAAMEAVARVVSGDDRATLGALLSRSPRLLPKPLDSALEKIWGYASEVARHGREGTTLTEVEVELVVGLIGQLVTYLLKANPNARVPPTAR